MKADGGETKMKVGIGVAILGVVIAALVGGAAGAVIALRMQPERPSYAGMDLGVLNARKVVADEVVARAATISDEDGAAVRIGPDGIRASGAVSAASVRARTILGENLMAVSNPGESDLRHSRIYAELAASARTGGVLVLRNREAVLVPARGKAKEGSALCLGQDRNGAPSIYVQDLARGSGGVEFIYHPALSGKEKSSAGNAGEEGAPAP